MATNGIDRLRADIQATERAEAGQLVAENGRQLKPHDGLTEWSVCGKCGALIDWASDAVASKSDGLSCPFCGHHDTVYLYAD